MAFAGSRYELMTDTSNTDGGTDTYPDCLSFFTKLDLFKQSEPPLQYEVTPLFLQRPYMVTYSYYGLPIYDDLVLLLNDIPYITELEEGEVIYLPAKTDIFSFYTIHSTIGGESIND